MRHHEEHYGQLATQDMTGTGQYITGGINYYYNDDHGDISHDSYYPNEYDVTVTYGENK